jgi:tripartite-type tricarboxylate transporter receptor subunit TctC
MRRVRILAPLVLLLAAAPVVAQDKYPSRPIDFIVTWGTGGGADGMARELGSLAQPILGVALPVSNVPGASGNTGLAQVLNGKPDGYAIATYIADTLATIPAGLARHKIDDLEWIARTQVADSSTPRPIPASCAWPRPATDRWTTSPSAISTSAATR